MRRKYFLGLLVVMLLLALIPAAGVLAGPGSTFNLVWTEVVPTGSGNPNMFGDASVSVNAGQGRLCYAMRVFIYAAGNNWPPTGAAIYRAPAGANGPLVVDLQPDFGQGANADGCLTIDRALAHDLKRNPEEFYLQVTDLDHPDGAARGQLVR